jgi:TROVE domain
VTATRIKQLLSEIGGKKLAAKAALYARKGAGMRSVTHLVASELAHAVKGETWTAKFYDRIVHHPDDALEILACYLATHGRPIPNALKKGLGAALSRFDEYQLAKYRKTRAEISLVDVVNLVHPPHTEALRKLVTGTLAPAETWETKLTQAGAAAESDVELAELKKDVWAKLLTSRKIGSINSRDTTLTVATWLERQCAAAGTNFHSVFQRAKRAYARVIILSDMQGWIGQYAPVASFAAWAKKDKAAPKVYSFDLALRHAAISATRRALSSGLFRQNPRHA